VRTYKIGKQSDIIRDGILYNSFVIVKIVKFSSENLHTFNSIEPLHYRLIHSAMLLIQFTSQEHNTGYSLLGVVACAVHQIYCIDTIVTTKNKSFPRSQVASSYDRKSKQDS
jgi:hypothetical protein